MSRLRESTVQKKALKYLQNHYKDLYDADQVYARTEVKTTKRYGGNRADGLLCFHSTRQREYTISLEAKSHRTIGSLIPFWEDSKSGLHSLLAALIISTTTILLLPSLEWYWLTLVIVFVFITTSVLATAFFGVFELDQHKSLNVVRQAHQYPANEKWIAIPRSSYNLINGKRTEFQRRGSQENFLRICRRNKVGVLLISRQKIDILQPPVYVPGYYLESYCIKSKVQSFLHTQTQAI